MSNMQSSHSGLDRLLAIQPVGNWASSNAACCFGSSAAARHSLGAGRCQTRPLKSVVCGWHGSICRWKLA